ncbi:MAG: OmpA family protein [Bacteroidia bacterium]|nr:OmpA family protein [Bacteroidia bacterium]
MKIFTKFLSLALALAVTSGAEAQTVTRDSVHASIKSGKMPRARQFNTWDVTIHGGLTYPSTDISASDFNASNVKRQSAYGINVTKFLTHSFALQAQFIRGELSGEDSNKPIYKYNTDVDYDVTLNALFQIGNIAFLKKTPNLAFYGYVGIGMINFTPKTTKDGGETFGNYYIQDGRIDSVNYKNTSEMVIPFGLGVKYRISKSFSLHGEYSFRTTNSDKLDGWYRLLSEDDDYNYLNIGLTWHIGAKEKTIEWVNPLQTIYADLYDMKDKVDLMSGDKDNDGVADMFDKEPDTPEGVKVYGDGTSVDNDGDGVPDYKDAEPFSAKGVKVDASGREIDTDGDGIPDSRDLEPNTAKGSLVNNTGVTIPTGPSAKGGSASILAANGYLPSIFFDLNSAVIEPKYNETLASIALVMKNNPDLKFELSGNTDKRASDEYNMKLGKRRAEAVKDHLVKKYGIDASRLDVVSLGKRETITRDYRMNRRVDFKVKE